MSRVAVKINLTPDEQARLVKIVRSGKSEARLVQRAQIILACAQGLENQTVAKQLSLSVLTVSKWRKRFADHSFSGLSDAIRSGKPADMPYAQLRDKVINKASEAPPQGYVKWDGKLLASELGISKDKVWRVMRQEGISLSRTRTWCVSTDPEFATKSAEIVALYLAPPTNAMVLSIDEKPQIQTISRTTGYVKLHNGKTLRAIQSTYKRNGTLNLFAALNTITGEVKSKTTQRKTRADFLAFMDEVVADIPQSTELHVILDNYCIHKKCDSWLEAHPNVQFHFTPTSASWLNQIEIFFGIMTRKILRGVSYENTKKLAGAIKDYIEAYNKTAEPFRWRKREVRGAQLADNITNLCN